MAAHRPEDAHSLFTEAFNAGNLDALGALYEADATMVPQPGQPTVTGGQAIRGVLQGFLQMNATIVVETESVVQAGDIALLRSQWRLAGTGPDGEPIEMSHSGTEVVRRQADGTWLYIIDHPFGAD